MNTERTPQAPPAAHSGTHSPSETPIDRRRFVRAAAGLVVVMTAGAACDDGGGVTGGGTGIIRFSVVGLQAGFTSAGTVLITGDSLDQPITIPLTTASGQATVKVGTYHAVYSPPAGYEMANGATNEFDVTIARDEIEDVSVTVSKLVTFGTLRLTVSGHGSAPGAGSAQVLRTDIAGQTPVTVPIPAAGTVDASLAPGTYSVTYTPPSGFVLTDGQTNPATVVIGDGELETLGFTVIAAIGTVRVTVTGHTGGGNAGSVSVLRTDIGGQTPTAFDIPVAATLDIALAPGTYSVDYTPPSGFQLTAGQTDPATATVTVNAVTPVGFAIEPAVTPGGVAFHSDWSTALGSSTAAWLDTSKAMPWDSKGGNGDLNVVVLSTGLDFPTAHVYKNIAEWSGNSGQTVFTDQLRLSHLNNRIPIPPVGGSLYYRWYQRYVVPDSIDPTGGTPHTVQDGPSAGSMNWMWETPINQNGTWNPQFNFALGNAFPNNRWRSPALNKNQTYRIEFRYHRVATMQFVPHVRIFNSAGTQVQGDADFENRDGTLTFADNPTLNINDLQYLAGWQMGNNGPSWNNLVESQFPFDLWYFGGAVIRTDDWAGPYQNGI